MSRKIAWFVALFTIVTGLFFYDIRWSLAQLTSSASLTLDLTAPDALIRSKSLSRLPADLLKVPLLHELLSEDFLFYYEHSESRLGLSGTIRRIAYEHNVSLTDELIKLVMDEPADVALWRGSKGELKYYTIAMTRNSLAKMLEPLAKIAMKDRQLSLVAETNVDSDTVQVFALEYARHRRMLIATHDDRVLVISDPSMVLNNEGALTVAGNNLLSDLLGPNKLRQQRFATDFALKETTNDHSIAFKTNFLSFHYQHFFPTLKALRFDFGKKSVFSSRDWSTAVKSLMNSQSWSTSMMLDADPALIPTLLNGKALWSALPYQPGACVILPADWFAIAHTMNSQEIVNMSVTQLASIFNGPVAMCWYASSRLHSPLFVAQINNVKDSDIVLEKYFNYGIRQSQPEDEKTPPEPAYTKSITTKAGDILWKTTTTDGKSQPTLARSDRVVYFSPDTTLVSQALSVAHKRQPAVSDSWNNINIAPNTIALVNPEKLAKLAEQEVILSLPRQQDELLRNAADQHLLPKLAAVKKYQPMRLEIAEPPKSAGWIELTWQEY